MMRGQGGGGGAGAGGGGAPGSGPVAPGGRSRPIGALVAAAVLAGLLPGGGAASAQEDFRALDPGRPLRVTDAYPKKLGEWEVQAGLRGERAEAGRSAEAGVELETGLLPNFEVGIGVESAVEEDAGETASGLGGASLHALYNFNQEGWSWPAFGLQVDVQAPVGDPGREEWGVGAGLVATRSFASRLRLHLNAGYLGAAVRDGGDVWTGGLALDYPLGLTSRLLVGDVYVEVPRDSGRSRIWTELGARLQLTNRTVLDAGVATRLDEWVEEGPHLELIVGLSRVFGIASLTGAPAYPEPAVR